MHNDSNNSKLKQISAIVALVLGLILAIGYPTGGVKADKEVNEQIVTHKNFVTHPQNNNVKKPIVKKEKPKKKRVIPIAPQPGNAEESQDEGC